jgi:hypothetical protein
LLAEEEEAIIHVEEEEVLEAWLILRLKPLQ